MKATRWLCVVALLVSSITAAANGVASAQPPLPVYESSIGGVVTPSGLPGLAGRGFLVYSKWCTGCHAGDYRPTAQGEESQPLGLPSRVALGTYTLQQRYQGAVPAELDERTDFTPAVIETFVRHGVNAMPPFRKTEISDDDLKALAAYLTRPREQTTSGTAPSARHERYVVSGASGQLGGLVVKELLRRGVSASDLILVSRTPEKLADYARQGAAVRVGDALQPETLGPAYSGGTRMLLISLGLGNPVPRSELHQRAIDAAVKAGVTHIVYTSFIGADKASSPIARDHTLTEAGLRASGATWTILRNGEYAGPWVFTAAAKMLSVGKATVPSGERRGAPVAYEDCAAAAASALLNPAAVNQIYEVTGPELVGTADIARAVSEVTGRRIDIVKGPAVSALPPAPPPFAPGVSGPGAVGGPGGPLPPAAGPGAPLLPPSAAGPDIPTFTSAQLIVNARRFRALTGRDPLTLKQVLAAKGTALLDSSASAP